MENILIWKTPSMKWEHSTNFQKKVQRDNISKTKKKKELYSLEITSNIKIINRSKATFNML